MSNDREFLSDGELTKIFQDLLELRSLTNQSLGQKGAQGKNFRAQQALLKTGYLIDHLAGWASHHIIGTKIKEQNSGNRKSGKADSHDHEILGRDYKSTNSKLDREILAFQVGAGSYVPPSFRTDLQSGLQALNTGEQTPLMTPSSAGEWRQPYSLAQIRLRAILHLHYLWGRGGTKKKALETIATSFNASPHSVRDWERKYVPEKRGDVVGVYATAKRAGKMAILLENGGELDDPIDVVALLLHQKLSSETIEDLAEQHIDCLKST